MKKSKKNKQRFNSAKEALENQDIVAFEAGEHTNSAGSTKEWTVEELQEIAQNTDLSAAANVINHPAKTEKSKSLADFSALTVKGKQLVARLKNVNAKFAESVKVGFFPFRSSRIIRDKDSGKLKLEHLGWLQDGVSPAIAGMPAVEFSKNDDNKCDDFYEEFEDSFQFSKANKDIEFVKRPADFGKSVKPDKGSSMDLEQALAENINLRKKIEELTGKVSDFEAANTDIKTLKTENEALKEKVENLEKEDY